METCGAVLKKPSGTDKDSGRTSFALRVPYSAIPVVLLTWSEYGPEKVKWPVLELHLPRKRIRVRHGTRSG